MLILDNIAKNIIRNKEGHLTIKRGQFSQEDITMISVYESNNKALNNMKQKLVELPKEIEKLTVKIKDFHIPLSKIDRTKVGRKPARI